MTGNLSLFFDFVAKKKGFVTHGDYKLGWCAINGCVLKDPCARLKIEKESLLPENNEEEVDQAPKEKEEDQPSEKNDLPLAWKSSKDHLMENILGDISKGVTTWSRISNFCL